MSFMTKEHSKEIMTRSRLRKNFQKRELKVGIQNKETNLYLF